MIKIIDVLLIISITIFIINNIIFSCYIKYDENNKGTKLHERIIYNLFKDKLDKINPIIYLLVDLVSFWTSVVFITFELLI